MIKIKSITLRLEDDLHQEFKMHSVRIKENMQDILVRLIHEELKKSEIKNK